MYKRIKTDVLVIGAGNAGFFAAIKAAEQVAKDRGVTILDRFMITDLIRQGNRITGAVGFSADETDSYIFEAKAVVMVAENGGIKNAGFWTVTTTGDAQAMAYRVGCALTGKEWSNYHPARADFPAYAWSGGIDRDYFVLKSQNAKHHGLLVYNNEDDFVDAMRKDPEAAKRTTGQIFDGARMAYEAHCGRGPMYFSVDWDSNTRQMNHSPKDMPWEQIDEDASKEGKVRMAMGRAMGQSHHLSDGIWPTDDYSCAAADVEGLTGGAGTSFAAQRHDSRGNLCWYDAGLCHDGHHYCGNNFQHPRTGHAAEYLHQYV